MFLTNINHCVSLASCYYAEMLKELYMYMYMYIVHIHEDVYTICWP